MFDDDDDDDDDNDDFPFVCDDCILSGTEYILCCALHVTKRQRSFCDVFKTFNNTRQGK